MCGRARPSAPASRSRCSRASSACSSTWSGIKDRWSPAPCCLRRSGTFTLIRRPTSSMSRSADCAIKLIRASFRRCCIRHGVWGIWCAPMAKLWDSVAFRMALGYGMLSVGSMALIAAVFYVGTVVVLNQQIDQKLLARSNRLTHHYEAGGMERLQQAIQQLLDDGLENDTEVYLLVGPDGRTIVGNLSDWTKVTAPLGRLTTQAVTRNRRVSTSRILPRQLGNGATVVVGRDLSDMRQIEQVVWRTLTVGGAVACLLAIGGALLFRR